MAAIGTEVDVGEDYKLDLALTLFTHVAQRYNVARSVGIPVLLT